MTLEEAKIFGKKQALKKTAIIVVLILLFFLYQETKGDFANGVLFFFDAILSVRVIGIFIILFGLTYIFGKRAGRAIIFEQKLFVPIALKYAIIITLFVTVPQFLITIIGGNASEDLQEFGIAFILGTALWTLPILLAWLWATYKMRLASKVEASQPTSEL